MLLDGQVLAFTMIAGVLTLTPGADMALVLRNTLAYGRASALPTIAGICSGLLVHATLSAVGLSALLAQSTTAFEVVRLVGAGYLLFLGAQTLWRARHDDDAHAATDAAGVPRRQRGAGRAFLEGLLNNVLNPKVALFYLTFLPQFLSPGDPVLEKSLLLASIHLVQGVLWLTLYAWMVVRLSAVLQRAGIRQRLEQATGLALLALGARLAWERR